MDRRSFVAGTAAALATRPAFAQEAYPSRAITIISPFPPGGASEVVTRPLAAAMEPLIKQNGAVNQTVEYLGRDNGRWIAGPTTRFCARICRRCVARVGNIRRLWTSCNRSRGTAPPRNAGARMFAAATAS